MEKKTTSEVEELLKSMKPEQLSEFYKENRNSMVDDKKAFYYYMKDVIESKNILLKNIYLQSGVSEKYGEKIFRMERHTTNRDLIIKFCIAGHFSVDETNKALTLYGMNPLYARNSRDAAILLEIHNRNYDILKVDDTLEQQGFERLLKEE